MSLLLYSLCIAYQCCFVVSTPIIPDQAPNSTSLDSQSLTPSIRSTDPSPVAALIWGCVATVFATSWLAVHPNIPDRSASWVRRVVIRAELMMWTVVAPELLVMWAVQQWIAAKGLADKYRGKGWTTTHGFFLQMGGLMTIEDKNNTYVLSPYRFDKLLNENKIKFPEVKLQDIESRSMGAGFAGGAAVLQTVWFIAQLGSKLNRKQLITQLELATAAIVILNASMCTFWWHKPRDIRLPMLVHRHLLHRASSTPTVTNSFQVSNCKDDISSTSLESRNDTFKLEKSYPTDIPVLHSPVMVKLPWYWAFRQAIISRMTVFVGYPQYRLPNTISVPILFFSRIPRRRLVYAYTVTTLLGLIFGGIHCIAWNFNFPSDNEALLWKIACGVMVGYLGAFLVILLPQLLFKEFSRDDDEPASPLARWFEVIVLWCVCAPIYVAARVYVLVEVVLALRVVPMDNVGISGFNTFLPHV